MPMYSRCYSTEEILDIIEYQIKYSAPLSNIHFVLSLVTCVIGLIGNAIVIFFNIFVLKKHKSKIWFLNLAINDFVSLLLLPLQVFAIFEGHLSYRKHLCNIFLFIVCVNMYASIFILIALNISRVLSVAKPMFHRTFIAQRISRWICLMIWIITILISLPVLLFSGEFRIGNDIYCNVLYGKYIDNGFKFNLTEHLNLEEKVYLDVNSKFHYFIRGCTAEKCCGDENTLAIWNNIIFLLQCFTIPLLVIGYFFPFCVILFSNITIAVQVRKSQTVNPHRLYKIVITIIIVYFVTWTPAILGEMILLAAVRNMNLVVMLKVLPFMPLLYTIAYTNSCLNPIMYVLVGRQVRHVLADFISNISIRSS